jgi:hypothetical protein
LHAKAEHMSKQLAIVSGSDATYFHFLRGLVRSLRDNPVSKATPLCIFDAGLSEEQARWLKQNGAAMVKPKWKWPREVPGYTAMMAARPSIPDYFPGYDVYLWMDADTWLQDGEAVAAYARGAAAEGFCITAESHPTYNTGEIAAARRKIRAQFSGKVSTTLDLHPPINLGVFAGRRTAPHWAVWKKYVDMWLQASSSHDVDFNADQESLSLVIYGDGLGARRLPARYNWLCHTSTPMVSEDGMVLLEPQSPFAPLAVIHMTLWAKRKPAKMQTPSGAVETRPLTYHADPLPHDIGDYPDFAVNL